MEFTFKEGAVTDQQFSQVNRTAALDKKDQQQEDEGGTFGADEIFIAGQMKYNPVVSGLMKARSYLGDDGRPSDGDPVQGYNPFDDPVELGGYPMELFVNSSSPQQTLRIKSEYDRDVYLDKVTRDSGLAGIASSVAGGAINPLYMAPYLRIGQSMRYSKSIADAAIGEAITESAFQGMDFDQLRTTEESIFNIVAGGVVGGVLGGAMRRNTFTKEDIDEIEKKLVDEFKAVDDEAIRAKEGEVEQTKPVTDLKTDVPGVDRIKGRVPRTLSKLTPLRILSSESPVARRLGALLGEQNVVGTSRAAIETLVKKYDSFLGKAFRDQADMWKQYKRRPDSTLSRNEFYEAVVDALRAGDVHTIPDVQAAAQKIRRNLLDPVRNKAADVGIFPSTENVQKFADGYYPRMYNFDLISSRLAEFKTTIRRELSKQYEGFSDEAISQAADEIARTIRHKYNGQNALSSHAEFTVSALKGRKVPIRDEVLKPWLVNDPELVLRAWSHNMATQTEMTRMFGKTNIDELKKQVEEDWDKIITEASKDNPVKAMKLNRKKNDDMAVIDALVERLMNRYKLPENPTSSWVRAGKAARNLNILRLLGGMTLSALPDLARPLYQHHFGRYAKALSAMTVGSPHIKAMLKSDAQRAGVALEMVLNQRMKAITEMDYIPSVGKGGYVQAGENLLERALVGRGGAGWDFGTLSLMSPWNANTKMMTFIMDQDGLLKHVMKPNQYAKKLKRAGIDEGMSRRMAEQYKKFGKNDGGLRIANLDEWDDVAAADLFEATLLRGVDSTIITPGIMDKPLWTSSEMGKLIGQFKSFAFAATNKQYLAGMNNFDAMFIQGNLAAISLGALTWSLKRKAAGYDDQEMSNTELLMRGVEYSGVIGFGAELINLGTAAASAAGVYKGEGNFRWAKQGLLSSVMGPSAGLGSDILRSGRYFTSEEPNAGDVEALRRIMPYNNLIYMRWAFDGAEQYEKQRLGVAD